ncbi:MAG: DUF6064 family protein [Ramlibacter sp.]|nr:DUF6064 family protein [Ramlibacter sp.]
MSEWWTYRLSDFLMFSPATYWRLLERYNREVWPLHLLAIAAGAMLLWWVAVRARAAGQLAAAVLAAVWLWVGWAFHWQRYAPINWAAEYFAMAFALQAVLLFAVAATAKVGDTPPAGPLVRAGGLALAAIGVFAYPFLAFAAGRPWSQAEVFGLMPDPTALATLGFLLATRLPRRGWLAVIPALSLAVGLATALLLRP